MSIDIGRDLSSVPFGEMVHSMAIGIADAQWKLDKASMTVTELMSGQRLVRDLDTGELLDASGNPTGTPTVIDSRVFFGYDIEEERDADGNLTGYKREPRKLSMIELGFVPTFYQFVDTIIEVKISVSMVQSSHRHKPVTPRTVTRTTTNTQTTSSQSSYSSYSTSGWWYGRRHSRYKSQRTSRRESSTTMSVRTVDAAFSNKYNYSIEGSAYMKTKLVPIPPPAILEDRIRQLMEFEQEFLELQMALLEPPAETVEEGGGS